MAQKPLKYGQTQLNSVLFFGFTFFLHGEPVGKTDEIPPQVARIQCRPDIWSSRVYVDLSGVPYNKGVRVNGQFLLDKTVTIYPI